MRVYLNKLILAFIVLISSTRIYAQVIKYKHLGVEDKPMPEMIFSTKKKLLKKKENKKSLEFWVRKYLVETQKYDSLCNYLSQRNTGIIYNKQAEYEFGAYLVTVVHKKQEFSFVLPTSELSKQFITGQFFLFKDQPMVLEELEILIRRLQ